MNPKPSDAERIQLLERRLRELESREAVSRRTETELLESRERFELAMRGSSDGIWDWDLRSDTVYYAPRFVELLGYEVETFPKELDAWLAHIHDDDRDHVVGELEAHLKDGDRFDVEYRLRTHSGEYQWFHARGECLRDAWGKPIRMAGSISNVSERRAAEKAALESQHTYQTLFETIRDGILVTDLDGKVVEANPALLEMLRYTIDEIRAVTYQDLTPEEHRERDLCAVEQCLDRGYSEHFEKEYLRSDGTRVPIEIRVWLSDTVRGDGRQHLIGMVRDITERRQSEERIRRLAYFDDLTGLPNRQLFQNRLDQAIEKAREIERSVAVLFVDLDHFKNVNDTLGHRAGDRLLGAVAQRFAHSIRGNDLVARAGNRDEMSAISRLGGDEFTVLVTVKEREQAGLVAERLLRSLVAPLRIDGHDIFVGASIGIATFPEDAKDAEALTRNADTAMYQAKANGRGVYTFYSESMNAMGLRRLELDTALRRSFEEGAFELFFQQQRHSKRGDIVGCEALLRWKHEGEYVSPVEFIPIAEETGLIIPLGDWVLEAACRQIQAWDRSGISAIPISVNVAANQFQDDDFPNRLERILGDSGTDAALVELEITESAFMHDAKTIARTFERIKDLGITIALDDFGTGYSSLSYLRRFPIDRVKIDRSFVREITTNDADRALIEAIIGMVHTLGMTVVAEGVETLEQAEILRGAHCDYLQGYLLGRPLPIAEFEASLEAKGTLLPTPAAGERGEREQH